VNINELADMWLNETWLCNTCSPFQFHKSLFNGTRNRNLRNSDTTPIDESIPVFSLPRLPRGLKIAHLNINRIYHKLDQLKLMLKNKPFDIFAVSETWTNSNYDDAELQIPGYSIIRRDRNGRAGGGVAIYILNDLYYVERQDLVKVPECICTEIKLPHSKSVFVLCCYRPPDSSTTFLDMFEETIESILSSNNELLVLGDINIDLRNPEHKDYNKLIALLTDNMLSQIINQYTRITSKTKTLIDHIYVSHNENILSSGTVNTGLSDHNLIYAVRSFRGYNMSNSEHKNLKFRCLKHLDVNNLISDLSSAPWSTMEVFTDVNDAWDIFKRIFTDVLDNHAPQMTKRVKASSTPWINDDVINEIRKRDFLFMKFESTGDITFFDQFKRQRNYLVGFIRRVKSDYYTTIIEENKLDPRNLWKSLKSILPHYKTAQLMKLKVNNEIITDPVKLANAVNEFFVNIGKTIVNSGNTRATGTTPSVFQKRVPDDVTFVMPTVSKEFVLKELKSMPTNKATGIDGISARILKLSAPAIASPLAWIINMSLTSGTVPDDWKMAKVVPIFKTGIKTDVNNYRPISVLSIFSKIIERAVHVSLYAYLERNNLIEDTQSGFRKSFSTSTALLKLYDDFVGNIDKGKYTVATLIDLRKAFDTVNHKILVSKLGAYGITGNMIDWFRSYLNTRRQRVSINGILSDPLVIETGVPQGSILGPLLFILFINDMNDTVQHSSLNCYADDTVCHAADANLQTAIAHAQNDLDKIVNWVDKNKLCINVAKTSYMIIRSVKKRIDCDVKLMVKGKPLDMVCEAKILGVIFDDKLNFRKHVDFLCKRISRKLGLLKRIRFQLSRDTAKLLFNCMILPLMEYCSVVWCNCDSGLKDRIFKLQKRGARVILNCEFSTPSVEMFRVLKWVSFSNRIDLHRAVLAYKAVNGLAPKYICDKFSLVTRQKQTRATTRGDLIIPRPNTEFFRRSFTYQGPKLWNALPHNVKSSTSVNSFKSSFLRYNI
jgi:exonuclease III